VTSADAVVRRQPGIFLPRADQILRSTPGAADCRATRQAPIPDRSATVYNVEKFFGWVTGTSDFCALTNR